MKPMHGSPLKPEELHEAESFWIKKAQRSLNDRLII